MFRPVVLLLYISLLFYFYCEDFLLGLLFYFVGLSFHLTFIVGVVVVVHSCLGLFLLFLMLGTFNYKGSIHLCGANSYCLGLPFYSLSFSYCLPTSLYKVIGTLLDHCRASTQGSNELWLNFRVCTCGKQNNPKGNATRSLTCSWLIFRTVVSVYEIDNNKKNSTRKPGVGVDGAAGKSPNNEGVDG